MANNPIVFIDSKRVPNDREDPGTRYIKRLQARAAKAATYKQQIRLLHSALAKWKARALAAQLKLNGLKADGATVHPIGEGKTA